MAAMTTTWFTGFCPLGDQCGKANQAIAVCQSLDEVKDRIKWHLEHCTHHKETPEAAEQLVEGALIKEEEVPDGDADGSDGQVRTAKDNGKGKDWRWRGSKDKSKRHDRSGWSSWGQGDSHGSNYRSNPYQLANVRPQPQPQPQQDVQLALQCITRCEGAARTAARMARSAALAFDEESAIMMAAMAKLQATITPSHD